MANFALNEGFNLCEILEISGDGHPANATYDHLRDWMPAADIAAMVFHGNVSRRRINRIAVGVGARAYELHPVFPTDNAAQWEMKP
jgi:hypothetical protein